MDLLGIPADHLEMGCDVGSNNKPPIFDGQYNPLMVIRGMVYDCYININGLHITHLQQSVDPRAPRYFQTLQKLESRKVEVMKQLGEGPELVWPLQLLGTGAFNHVLYR